MKSLLEYFNEDEIATMYKDQLKHCSRLDLNNGKNLDGTLI